ncbi:ribosomal maturation YjgA family protein [Nonomuraea sp. NPDC003727]|uniref:ribosomal maturation YjgA family protein n=1 Tax=Nonomuraea sp. NPDC003804 TaxID=3154547 RepID=UPI0033BA7518
MPRTRITLLAVVTIILGLVTRPFSKYAGDAFYTVLLYWIVVFAVPRVRPVVAAGVALAASWAIEFAQLLNLPRVLAPVLGSTFNPPDLFWYAVGAAAACAFHHLVRHRPATRE